MTSCSFFYLDLSLSQIRGFSSQKHFFSTAFEACTLGTKWLYSTLLLLWLKDSCRFFPPTSLFFPCDSSLPEQSCSLKSDAHGRTRSSRNPSSSMKANNPPPPPFPPNFPLPRALWFLRIRAGDPAHVSRRCSTGLPIKGCILLPRKSLFFSFFGLAGVPLSY